MSDETKVEAEVSPTETPETEVSQPSVEKSPVETELEKVESRKRTKLEKLEYTKKRIEEQIIEERRAEGLPEIDKDKPLTLADLEVLEQQRSLETAVTLTDGIEDEHERKLTKHYLETTIKPSGDAKTDFENARALVNAIKNKQLLEEVGRKSAVKQHASAASAPMNQKKDEQLTPEETQIMKGFRLTKEQVLAERPK